MPSVVVVVVVAAVVVVVVVVLLLLLLLLLLFLMSFLLFTLRCSYHVSVTTAVLWAPSCILPPAFTQSNTANRHSKVSKQVECTRLNSSAYGSFFLPTRRITYPQLLAIFSLLQTEPG